ncbi:1-acyl-sn-glycerol-3-phosphate acyltransferase [Psychromonas sp. Urea-02u-13]|nr:1-acyl-sn-glycerol-3-phosphate acyltransferase [Psychromonas sp. Urea-02u-13]
MTRILKVLFFALFIKPIVFIILGLNITFREKLPLKGPALLAPNHNSHLDTMVLISLYPLSKIHKVRPVAAADYFLSNKLLAWFSLNVIGIIPLDRKGGTNRDEIFSDCLEALDNGDILVVFPEGSRGEPEQLSSLKKGIYYLSKEHGHVPITPIVMHGLGRSLPRGEGLFVPFNCDIVIGDSLLVQDSTEQIQSTLLPAYHHLYQYCLTRQDEE